MRITTIQEMEKAALEIRVNLLKLCNREVIHIGGDLSIADIMTVLGVAPKETIQAACECAKKYGKHICVDMINVTDQVSKAKEFILY